MQKNDNIVVQIYQKSQNLPAPKSHHIHLRTPSTSLYNPVHRSISQPHEHRYGILRKPHLPTNSIMNNNTQYEPTRQSRSTFRHYDDRDDEPFVATALPMKVSPTTAIRSNSSDKVIDLRRTPQPSISSYSGYIPDDYELKRSFSAEVVQPPQPNIQQPQVPSRRTIPAKTSDYSMSSVSSYPITPTDQTYTQSNASKLTSYFNRIPPSALNSPIQSIPPTYTGTGPMYETGGMQDSDHIYSVVASSNRRTAGGLTSVLTRSPSNNSNNEYYFRDTASGSYSDDNSSSPSMLIQQRNIDPNQYRRIQRVVETDDDYRQQREIWPRSTARSHSSDGLTEKKRVRFADMEGYTLETVPDVEQQRSPVNNHLLTRRLYGQTSSNLRGQVQPFNTSFYQSTTRVGGTGSKLATDV